MCISLKLPKLIRTSLEIELIWFHCCSLHVLNSFTSHVCVLKGLCRCTGQVLSSHLLKDCIFFQTFVERLMCLSRDNTNGIFPLLLDIKEIFPFYVFPMYRRGLPCLSSSVLLMYVDWKHSKPALLCLPWKWQLKTKSTSQNAKGGL